MFKTLLFLRDLNWLTISSLILAAVSVLTGILNATLPLTLSTAGASISLALLALRD